MPDVQHHDQAPISGAVYGVLLNSQAELDALGDMMLPPYKAPPSNVVLYIKTPNTYLPGGGAVSVPADAASLRASPAIALLIGRNATRVAAADAFDYVAGVAAALDVCVPHKSVFRPSIKERCRDGFLPIGGWAAPTASPVLTFGLNGGAEKHLSTDALIRSIPRLLAEITDFMTLSAGDVLLTGLAPNAPLVEAGDKLTVSIDGGPSMTVSFVQEAA